MELRLRLTRTRVAITAAALAVAATGSIGLAAVGDGGTIQGCVAQNGTIDALDEVTLQCKDRQTKVEWYTKAGADAALLNAGEATAASGYQVVPRTVTIMRSDTGSIVNPLSCPSGKRIINVINNGQGTVLPRAWSESATETPLTWTLIGIYDGGATSPASYETQVYLVCINATP